MKHLLAALVLSALLTSCPASSNSNDFKFPPAPTILDYGPHPAFLGQQVTITGPGVNLDFVQTGDIYDSPALTGAVYGQITTRGQLRLTLGTPPAKSKTGPITRLIPNVLPSYFPADVCSTSTVMVSAPATYTVPSFWVGIPERGGSFGDPGPTSVQVLPALTASDQVGYVLTGRLVYVDQDVMVKGQYVCIAPSPVGKQTLTVDVTLRAGWNVLREQKIGGAGTDTSAYAITGAAVDYVVTAR